MTAAPRGELGHSVERGLYLKHAPEANWAILLKVVSIFAASRGELGHPVEGGVYICGTWPGWGGEGRHRACCRERRPHPPFAHHLLRRVAVLADVEHRAARPEGCRKDPRSLMSPHKNKAARPEGCRKDPRSPMSPHKNKAARPEGCRKDPRSPMSPHKNKGGWNRDWRPPSSAQVLQALAYFRQGGPIRLGLLQI